jgi:metal-responsive CopG/Arc/MetJ family transcriptional regulator
MKTKLTISIDKELLKEFDEKCEKNSINKSKLISQFIKDWCKKKEELK